MAQTLGPSNGNPDSFFIDEVRRILRDKPVWDQVGLVADGTLGTVGAGSKPLRLRRAPVYATGNPGAALTAPAGASQPGLASLYPVYDITQTPPAAAPAVADGGAGGTWAAASYQIAYTYVTAAGESPLSPLTAATALVVNHQLQFGALAGIPTGVTSINVYAVTASAGGSNVGRIGSINVVASATPLTLFAAPPVTLTLPVEVVADTGEVIFAVAPGTGTVSVSYQATRFADAQITEALYEGLNLLWPEIWNPTIDTTSIIPNPVQIEYTLPTIFQDQRVILLEVECAPPSAVVMFKRWSGWRVVNDVLAPKLIFIHTPPPVGGQVRLQYATPFTSLGSVPVEAMRLPEYYALAFLLGSQEVMRGRSDDLPALTGETASPPQNATNTAQFWLQRFEVNLAKLGLDPPARYSVIDRAFERLQLHNPAWGRAIA